MNENIGLAKTQFLEVCMIILLLYSLHETCFRGAGEWSMSKALKTKNYWKNFSSWSN